MKRLSCAACVAIVMLAAPACGGPMRADELARSVDSLSATAAEGALMGREVARDHSKATFIRAHARELADSADHESEKLFDATASSGLASRKAAAVRLADDISQALGDLQTMPGVERAGREAAQALEALRQRADRLSEAL